MLSLNRYRLRHLVKKHHKGAKRASELLERPDRLLGVILVGNNAVNIAASMIAGAIGVKFLGTGSGELVAGAVLTFVVLIFAEVTPKTIAAAFPEKVAFPAGFLLKPLLYLKPLMVPTHLEQPCTLEATKTLVAVLTPQVIYD